MLEDFEIITIVQPPKATSYANSPANIVLITLFFFLSLMMLSACSGYRNVSDVQKVNDDVPESYMPDKAIFSDSPYNVETSNETFPLILPKPEDPPKPPEPMGKTTLKISAVGDIMVHKPQVESALQEDGSFDFKPVFQHIKTYIQQADIAIGNLETTISTPEKGFFGFPRFRSPKEVIEALKHTGFDVITTSNNHILDGFEFGLEHTLNTLDEYGLKHTGAARTPEERDSLLIIDKNGIKVAILAYTYGTNGMEAAIEEERLQYMVIFLHETERMLGDVKRARQQGAEVVIVCLHWGHEYHRKPDIHQEELAKKLIQAGVDIIFGSHPHVLQPIVKKTVTGEGSEEREGLIVYSMGNFVSNQRKRFRDSGIIVNVNIVKDHDLRKVYISEVTYVPTWVHRYSADGKLHYRILPVGSALDIGLYDEVHGRLAEVWSETTGHMGNIEPIR